MKKKILLLSLLYNLGINAQSQDSARLYQQLQQLNFLGSVLYVGAHPDDENTRVISYFSNIQHARTAYLSLTRGDGGQNLIGTELREGLGVIRTQELLEARKIDGGEQYFTMANDFGFSKNPEETLTIWNREELLQQVVARIRNFRPDIIINRFDHRTPGRTHGHHTTSALLSVAAFDYSNDSNAYPETKANGKVWQPKRLFYNTSWWAYGSRERFAQIDKTNLITVDVGAYDPILGISNATRAARSRSQHKSQGFGSSPNRGVSLEYLELINGAALNHHPFEGIDTTWNRVKGGIAIGKKVDEVLANFDFKSPEKSLPQLLQIYRAIQNLEDQHWKTIKTKEILSIIQGCAGWHFALTTTNEFSTPNTDINAQLEVVNPTAIPLQLTQFSFNGATDALNAKTANNVSLNIPLRLHLPNQNTAPYWLTSKGNQGHYVSEKEAWVGIPETPQLKAMVEMKIMGNTLTFPIPLTYTKTDPIDGEIVQKFQVLPNITVDLSAPIYMMPNITSTTVESKITNHSNALYSGEVSLELPKGWKAVPAKKQITVAANNSVNTVIFEVFPNKMNTSGEIRPVFRTKDKSYNKGLEIVNYPHIEKQFMLRPTAAKVVSFNFSVKHSKIGYIKGAGDKIPESLTAMGIQVDEIAVSALDLAWMQQYPTLIIGIRSFNVAAEWQQKHKILLAYVQQGGNVIVQYNTNRRLKIDQIGPYPLKISRNRVTDEAARVSILNQKHPLFQQPNVIGSEDFEGWVQERGLYFANDWNAKYQPLLAMNDAGEAPLKGSLLVTNYGQGTFIFTGLSFFRQLPAGVPGAYRLFANMISYE